MSDVRTHSANGPGEALVAERERAGAGPASVEDFSRDGDEGFDVREELATPRAVAHQHWPLAYDRWVGGSCTAVSGRTLTRRQADGPRLP